MSKESDKKGKYVSKSGFGEIFDNLFVEPVEKCKLVTERWVSNGHDCWGNSEGSTELYVKVNGEFERCFEGWYVIHDGKEAKEVATDWGIDNKLKQIESDREREEHLRRTGFETPREYEAYLKGLKDAKGGKNSRKVKKI